MSYKIYNIVRRWFKIKIKDKSHMYRGKIVLSCVNKTASSWFPYIIRIETLFFLVFGSVSFSFCINIIQRSVHKRVQLCTLCIIPKRTRLYLWLSFVKQRGYTWVMYIILSGHTLGV